MSDIFQLMFPKSMFRTTLGPSIFTDNYLKSLDDFVFSNFQTEKEDGTKEISFEMPGIKESDIEMEYEADSGYLYLKAERKTNNKHYQYSFHNYLGKNLSSDAIKANFEDNVLHLSFDSKKELPPKAVHKIALNK